MATIRYKIELNGESGAGTDYQVPLKIGVKSTSSGYDFHLDDKATDFPTTKNDGGDFRFYSSNGSTPLDFWVESVTGDAGKETAKVWVKVLDNLDSDKHIYLDINGGGASASDGDDTFIKFDDFDSGSLDGSKWEVTSGSANGTPMPSSDKYTISGSVFSLNRVSPSDYDNLFEVGTQNSMTAGRALILGTAGLPQNTSGTNNMGAMWIKTAVRTVGMNTVKLTLATAWNQKNTRTQTQKATGAPATWSAALTPDVTDETSYQEYKMRPNGTYSIEVNGSTYFSDSGFDTDEEVSVILRSYTRVTGLKMSVDYIIVRKLANTEPSFKSASEDGGGGATPNTGIRRRRILV